MYTPLLIGLMVATAVAAYGSLTELDRSPAFYTTVLIVVASYYVLFAVMAGARSALIADLVVMGVFAVLATLGQARNMWLVVGGLAAHGVMDTFHGRIIVNPGVPVWWPAWCAGYDVGAAILLARILLRQRTRGS